MRALLRVMIAIMAISMSISTNASHLLGGSITYEHVSGNDFQITVKLWRDINGINLPATAVVEFYEDASPYPAADIFSGANMASIPMVSQGLVPQGNQCFTPSAVQIEEGVYQAILTLPNEPNGYYVIFDDCCRNGSIINLDSPSSTGFSLVTSMPDPALQNSSPEFGGFPTDGFFCASNAHTIKGFTATDQDGDQLVYSFATPLDDANQIKPFTQVTWAAGYSLSDIVGGTPPMSIDPLSGHITASPNVLGGNYVFSVKVEEYRSGVKIGEVLADCQFTVYNCPACVTSCSIGKYEFSGNLADSSGYGNDATGTPYTASDRFSQPNTAVAFNSPGESITLPNQTYLNPTDAISISAWVKTTGDNRTMEIFGTTDISDLRATLEMETVTGYPMLSIASSSGSSYDVTFKGDSAINDGNWHHVVGAYDAVTGTGQIYVDNTQNTTTIVGTPPGSVRVTASDFTISGNNSQNWWLGSIDEVSIYGCALTSNEVDSIYQEESYSPNPPQPVEICFVSYDPAKWQNVVVWEQSPDTNVVGYNIYMTPVTPFMYNLIGYVSADSLSILYDTVGDPLLSEHYYQMEAVDRWGRTSSLSGVHATIHLEVTHITGGVELNWSLYSGVNFTNNRVYIARDSAGNGVFERIDSVTQSDSLYIDLNYIPWSKYRIEGELPAPCNPSKAYSLDVVVSNQQSPVYVGVEDEKERSFIVYPNPANDMLKFSGDFDGQVDLVLRDIQGRIVYYRSGVSGQGLGAEVDVSRFDTGVYFLEVIHGVQTEVVKIIKQ